MYFIPDEPTLKEHLESRLVALIEHIKGELFIIHLSLYP